MKDDTKKKAKQIGFIALISLATITLINTVAKKSQTVATVRDKMANGL